MYPYRRRISAGGNLNGTNVSALDEHAVQRIKKTEDELKEIFDGSSNKPKTQQVILEAVATLVTGKHSDALLKKTPAILMALYEIDLLEEAAVVKWHAKLADADEGFHSLEWREKVREAAARCFWVVHATWPSPAGAMRAKLDPAQQKLLKRLESSASAAPPAASYPG